MIKKMLLTGGLVLVAPGSSAQIMLGALIALVYLLAFVKASPYEEDADDVLEFVCTLAILLTLLGGFALKTQPSACSLDAADGTKYYLWTNFFFLFFFQSLLLFLIFSFHFFYSFLFYSYLIYSFLQVISTSRN